MKPFVAVAVLVAASLTAASAAPALQQQVAAGSRAGLGSSSRASRALSAGNPFGSAPGSGSFGVHSGFYGPSGAGLQQQSSGQPSVSFYLPGYGGLSYVPGTAGGQWSLYGNGYNGGLSGGYGNGYGYGTGYGYGNGNYFPSGYGVYGFPYGFGQGFGGLNQLPAGYGSYGSYGGYGLGGFSGAQSPVQQTAGLGAAARSSASSSSSSAPSRSA